MSCCFRRKSVDGDSETKTEDAGDKKELVKHEKKMRKKMSSVVDESKPAAAAAAGTGRAAAGRAARKTEEPRRRSRRLSVLDDQSDDDKDRSGLKDVTDEGKVHDVVKDQADSGSIVSVKDQGGLVKEEVMSDDGVASVKQEHDHSLVKNETQRDDMKHVDDNVVSTPLLLPYSVQWFVKHSGDNLHILTYLSGDVTPPADGVAWYMIVMYRAVCFSDVQTSTCS